MAKGPGKGVSNNPAGKPKGALNKTTKEARLLFMQIMDGEIDHIATALEAVRNESPAKYLDVMAKLFQYSMPKQLDVKTDDKPITGLTVTYVDKIKDNSE
jgi:hypothetical protein